MSRGHQDPTRLKLSYDRKVSPTGSWQESRRRWIPLAPNSFGLPSHKSCPGATSFCKSCYGTNSEQSKGVRALLDHNLRLLTEAGTTAGMARLIRDAVREFRRCGTPVGTRRSRGRRRIHWDGDFFSIDYARAWATVIAENPDISFWAYTRSFVEPVNVVPVFRGTLNLALYLSVDADNAAAAKETLAEHPWLLVALCGPTHAAALDLLDTGAPVLRCPENAGQMALMADGQGACVTCGVCPDARRDVIFTTSVPGPRRRRPDGAPTAEQRERRGGTCAACGAQVDQKQRGRPRKWCDGCKP